MCAGRWPCPKPVPLSAARRSRASRGRQAARGSLFKGNDKALDGPGRRGAAGRCLARRGIAAVIDSGIG